jgi:hypothetical protein
MKKLKLGNWISVNERMPGRDERVLAVDPNSGEQSLVTGAELAADLALEYWAPLASPESVREFFKGLREQSNG